MLGSSSRCVELFPCAVFWQTLRPWRVRYHRAREFPARHPHCSLAIRVLIRHNDIGLHEIQARFHSPRPANTELTSFWTTQLLLKFHSRWSKRLTLRCGRWPFRCLCFGWHQHAHCKSRSPPRWLNLCLV